MNVSALLYFLFVYIVYKTNNFDVINKSSTCGATNDCLRIIKSCDNSYKRKFSVYSACVNKAIFGRNFEFPDKDKYMNQMYNASTSKSSVAKNMRKVYFQIILSVLKSAGYDKEYESLYQDAMNSIIIDFQNLDFDLTKVQDKTYNEVAEIVYYNDLVNKYNLDFFDRKKFYNKENSVTNDAFLNELNVKYFENTVDTKYIKYILESLYNYNIEPILLSNPNINTTTLSEFQKKFLVDYNEYYSINDIMDYMEEDVTSDYNIFDFIDEVCTFLNKEFTIKYLYDENDKKMTSSLDFSSIYENVNTISELIYNLIFDYYNYIYAISVDKDYKDSYTFLHYFDEDDLYFTVKFGNTLDALMDSDFYKSIYYPIISFNKKNKGNKYISECVRLVEDLYKFTNGNYELKKIKKEKFTIKKDIDYKADIDELYDIQFRENSFLNLIENKDTDIYEDELRNYIHEYCLKYNKMGVDYSLYALSALNLENQYNNINEDNMIQMTYVLKKNEEEIYEAWYNQNLELIDDDKNTDFIVSEMMNIMKSNVAYNMIEEYLLNTYNNSTLRKRQNPKEEDLSPEKYSPFTQGVISDIVLNQLSSDQNIKINDQKTANEYYYKFIETEKRYRDNYKKVISGAEKSYFAKSETEAKILKGGPEIVATALRAGQEYVLSTVIKNSGGALDKLYNTVKGSIKRKHLGLALKNYKHFKEFNKYNKWNKFNNRHELEFLNVIRNYNKDKTGINRYTFESKKNGLNFNLDVTDDRVESYKKKKQYIEDLKLIYNKVLLKKLNAGDTKWQKDHPLDKFIQNLIVSSEDEYSYSNTNIHELASEDLNDLPENLFEKPSLYEAYGDFINHIYKQYVGGPGESRAMPEAKREAAVSLLRAIKNINNFDHTKKILSLTKLLNLNKVDGEIDLINALRDDEDKLEKLSNFIKENAVTGNDQKKREEQIKEIDAAMKKLSDFYRNAPFSNNNNNNNGENKDGDNGDGSNTVNGDGSNTVNDDGSNGKPNDETNNENIDDNKDEDDTVNNEQDDKEEGRHTTRRSKGKRSYPKTMFKRKF